MAGSADRTNLDKTELERNKNQELDIKTSVNQTEPADVQPIVASQQIAQSSVSQKLLGSGNLAVVNAPGSTTQINIHVHQSRAQDRPYGTEALLGNVPCMADQPTQVPATAARPSDCVSKSSEESTSTAAEKTSLAKHYSSLESIEQHRRVIERCAEALRTTYKSTGSYVPMIPWVDDDSKHIDEIYSGLMLETEEGLTDSERRSRVLETYGEIFEVKTKNGDPIHIAILKGEPGRGKSTLVKKMAYDWAVYIRVLQKYKLVFVLKMHALEQGCDVIDAISDQLLPWLTSSDRRVLDLYIQDSSDKVLFLMDGFDELMTSALCESSFGSVFHVLHRKKYTGCSVVVTTRPSHYANLVTKSLVQKPFTHVRVMGFGPKDICEYVNKFYPDELGQAEGLLGRIRSSDVLFDLAKSPMMLLLMCLLWRGESTLPETKSRLYEEALTYILKRKACMSPDDITTVVNEMGRVALRGLLSPSQILAFTESDFSMSVLDMAITAGVLTKQRVLKGIKMHNSIQFIHKTIQEFCAAKHMQNLLAADEQQFQKTLDQIVSLGPVKFDSLLHFCSGDSQSCLNAILRSFQEVQFDGKLRKLAINCYFEGQPAELPPVESIRSIVTDEIRLMVWDTDSLNALTYFLKDVADDNGQACLAQVQKVELLKCNIERFCESLSYSMSVMTNLLSLLLMDCSLTVGSMADIMSSMRLATNLAVLNLSYNEALGGSAALWASHLSHLKRLQSLVLSECALTGEDMKHIAVSLRDVPSVVELDISLNKTLAGSANVWCPCVKELEHLQMLGLVGCNMQCQDMKCIAEAVGSMRNLVNCLISFDRDQTGSSHLIEPTDCGIRLNLSQCSMASVDLADVLDAIAIRSDLVEVVLGGDSLAELHFRGLKHVQKVTLENCSIKREGLRHFLQSAGCMESLVDCSVSFVYDPEVLHLIQRTDADGIKVDLSKFSFDENDLARVLRAIGDRRDLVELSLNGNTLPILHFHLDHFTNLHRLRLENCTMNKADMKLFLQSVGRLTNIVDCSLGFVYEAKRTVPIKQTDVGMKVDLNQFPLNGRDLADVLEAMTVRQNLSELSLNEKVNLSDSAQLWAMKLRQFQHIQKLDLRNSSFTANDVTLCARSLRVLPSLVELNLASKGSIAACWCPYLQQLEHLKTLRLGTRKFEGKELSNFVAGFKGDFTCRLEETGAGTVRLNLSKLLAGVNVVNALTTLTTEAFRFLIELTLSGNQIIGGSSVSWAYALTYLKHLEKLDVSNCFLSGEHASRIIESLSDLPNLFELVLSGNELLGGSAEVWCPYLLGLCHLQSLKLCGCNFNDKNIHSLSLECFGRLLDCSISVVSDDETTYRLELTALFFGTRLRLNKPITNTNLSSVLQTINGHRSDVVELDLSGNATLSGTAELWSSSFRELQCLQELNLRNCSLTERDVQVVKTSIRKLAEIAVLYL